MTIRLKLYVGFFVLIAIFVISFFVNQTLSENVNKNSEYLIVSENIIRNSGVIHKNMIGMQSGFRGFLLTGQENFLDPYFSGLQVVPILLKQQHLLVTDKRQQVILDSIENLHRQWVAYASALIDTKIDTLPEAQMKYHQLIESKVKAEVGKKLNDQISYLFETFDGYEYAIRQDRRYNLMTSIDRTRSITLMLTLLSIVIAIVSSVYIVRLITHRISKMVRFASEISKGNFISITDHKKDELKELSVSLNSMSLTLNSSFNELSKKNNELDQFAYVVSHDLKAPLRGIDNISKWMIEDHGDEMSSILKENISLIRGRTRRLENMINGLLEYARIGRVKKGLEKVDVEKMLNELSEILIPEDCDLTIKGDMPVFVTEKLRLEQVFSNLMTNACKHNKAIHKKVMIESSDSGDHFLFKVSDNGPGIKEEYFEKVFGIFQTLQERDAFESTGVGLAIVKKIIDEQKSEIKLVSEVGKGTSVVFTWPKYSANKN